MLLIFLIFYNLNFYLFIFLSRFNNDDFYKCTDTEVAKKRDMKMKIVVSAFGTVHKDLESRLE